MKKKRRRDANQVNSRTYPCVTFQGAPAVLSGSDVCIHYRHYKVTFQGIQVTFQGREAVFGEI